MRITKSKINTYHTCPLMFKFQYIDKLEPEIPIPEVTQKGLDVHKLFCDFFEHIDLNKIPEEPFDYFFNSMEIDKKYQNIFKRFCNNEVILQRLKQKPIYREKDFSFEDLYGFVDRINFDGKNYSLIDYKSSVYDADKLRFELCFYSHLVNSTKILSIPIRYIGIYGYNDGKLLFEPIKPENYNSMLEIVKQFRVLKFDKINYPARLGSHCKWCVYPKSCTANKQQTKLEVLYD